MTWAEFQLRLFAFNRSEKREWLKLFEATKTIIEVAPYLKGSEKSNLIKQKYNNYLGGGKEKKELNSRQIEIMKKAQQQYYKNKQ